MPYVFGYGSLILRESAAKTLGRTVAEADHIDAVLVDHRVCWGTPVQVLMGENFDMPAEAVFLDLQAQPGVHCCGAVFQVTEDELAKIDLRERQYTRINVSEYLIPAIDGEVFAYFRDSHVDPPSEHAVVMRRYHAMIEQALAAKRPCFQALWRSGCAGHEFAMADGPYKFFDPEQNASAGR